ncbi:V-type ATP synthase subunit E [Iocasia frigidifontis]|nr:V-type ATP synthase subunit E [Iocasia fonsfrigidae]
MDIEKKVMAIRGEIIDEVEEKKERLLLQEKEKWDQEYKDFQDRLKLKEEEIELYYKQEAQKKREQIISRAILDRKKVYRNNIDQCIARFEKELGKQLQSFRSKKEYIEFLINSIKESIKLLEGSSFIINISKEDINLSENLIKRLAVELPDYHFTIKENQTAMSGGVIVKTSNGNEIVEYTFNSLIKNYQEKIALEIQENVFLQSKARS